VATTGQPYVFTGDNPLNATDPLGMRGTYCMEGVTQQYSGDLYGKTGNGPCSASNYWGDWCMYFDMRCQSDAHNYWAQVIAWVDAQANITPPPLYSETGPPRLGMPIGEQGPPDLALIPPGTEGGPDVVTNKDLVSGCVAKVGSSYASGDFQAQAAMGTVGAFLVTIEIPVVGEVTGTVAAFTNVVTATVNCLEGAAGA